jgi:hypothetical protein
MPSPLPYICIRGWQVCVKFIGPMEMLEWDTFLNLEQNIVDYMGFKTFFQTNGIVGYGFLNLLFRPCHE